MKEDGTFTQGVDAKLLYAGMMSARAEIPMSSSMQLAKALTIAIRYSCVRHQSELHPGSVLCI